MCRYVQFCFLAEEGNTRKALCFGNYWLDRELTDFEQAYRRIKSKQWFVLLFITTISHMKGRTFSQN